MGSELIKVEDYKDLAFILLIQVVKSLDLYKDSDPTKFSDSKTIIRMSHLMLRHINESVLI